MSVRLKPTLLSFLNPKQVQLLAFDLMSVIVGLCIVAVMMAASINVISQNLESGGSGGEGGIGGSGGGLSLRLQCSNFGDNEGDDSCKLCTSNLCLVCVKDCDTANTGRHLNYALCNCCPKDCTECEDNGSGGLTCTKCSGTKVLEGSEGAKTCTGTCPSGKWCSNGEAHDCEAGTYCENGIKKVCPDGEYCTGGSHHAQCPVGKSCSASALINAFAGTESGNNRAEIIILVSTRTLI